MIYSHFIIRVASDPRLTLSVETLSAASRKYPNSPRILYRLAGAENSNTNNQGELVADAITHAERAVSLSQWDYKMRRLLATLQEINGDQENAEKSMRAAARLAPNNVEVNWALANLLLRRGKLNDSVESFRKAAGTNEDLLPLAFELLWQSSGGDLETLNAMTANNPSAQLSLVQFFVEQSMINEALGVFRSMDRNRVVSSSKTTEFIDSLIKAGQFEIARMLWIDLVASSKKADGGSNGGSGGLLWNGGFEMDSVKNFDQFNWTITPTEYARIGLDNTVSYNGSRSLKVAFAGRDTTKLQGEIKQLVVLRPGARYQLECYAKGSELISPEGPRIAILGKNGVIATSEPVAEGSNEWQRLVVDFVAPEDNSPNFVAVVRIPKFSYDDPTRGAVWFDDFTLAEVAQK